MQQIYLKSIKEVDTEIKMLNYLKNFGLKKHLFIISHLKLIQLNKKMLVLEVLEGTETIIPQILREESLPQSYKFYNPILKIMDSMMDERNKHQYNV